MEKENPLDPLGTQVESFRNENKTIEFELGEISRLVGLIRQSDPNSDEFSNNLGKAQKKLTEIRKKFGKHEGVKNEKI